MTRRSPRCRPKSVIATFLLGAGLVLCSPADSAPNALAQIQESIESGRVTSIGQLLQELPSDLRRNYALMFFSRSLQGATFRNPRVLMYSRASDLVLTFNGDAHQRGYDTIELMAFDSHEKRLKLQELTFTAASDGAPRAELSEVNPSKCAPCHGSPVHPIWDSPPAWPGAYGEVYQSALSADETAGFEEFLAHRSENRRYASLLDIPGYQYRLAFRPAGRERYDGVKVESPNGDLRAMLSSLNFRSWVAAVRRSADYRAFRYAFLGALRQTCGSPATFFPPERQARVDASFRAFAAELAQSDVQQRTAKADRLESRHTALQLSRGADDYGSQASLRFLGQFALGVDDRHWSMDLETGGRTAMTTIAVSNEFENELLRELGSIDSVPEALHLFNSQASSDRYCDYLVTQSQKSIAALSRSFP